MLARNADVLERDGTLVARTGRSTKRFGTHLVGHHNVGLELLGDPAFDPTDGSLADLERELRDSQHDRAVISSESIGFAHQIPGALDRLRDTIRAAGFRPKIVMYLRDQAAYSRSMYAMFVITHKSTLAFRDFCDAIIDRGGIVAGDRTVPFEYDRLLRPFEAAFGKEHLIVRPYVADGNSKAIMRDFLRVLNPHAAIDDRYVATEAHLNAGGSLAQVLSALHGNLSAERPALPSLASIAAEMRLSQATLQSPFDPVDARLFQRFREVFARSNRAIYRRYGIGLLDELGPAAASTAQLSLVDACAKAWKNAGSHEPAFS